VRNNDSLKEIIRNYKEFPAGIVDNKLYINYRTKYTGYIVLRTYDCNDNILDEYDKIHGDNINLYVAIIDKKTNYINVNIMDGEIFSISVK
jgi:hypothetical protein